MPKPVGDIVKASVELDIFPLFGEGNGECQSLAGERRAVEGGVCKAEGQDWAFVVVCPCIEVKGGR